MEQAFETRLTQVLQKEAEELKSHEVPELKEALRIYHSAFQGLTEFLYRNAVISEDPYAHEHKIGSVSAPDNSAVSDNDKENKLSMRLSYYNAMLDYVNNYYQFSLDALTIPELKRLGEMVMFWKWNQLSPNAEHHTTQLLGHYVQRLRSNSDSMATGVIKENVNQLIRSQSEISKLLKKIGAYRRELYKLHVRETVIDSMNLTDVSPGDIDNVVSQVKPHYKRSNLHEPFYPELIREVIEEDYTEAGRESRDLKLQSLGEEKKSRQASKEADEGLKKELLEAVKAIAAASRHLEECVTKLQETSQAYESRRRTLWVRIKRWLYRASQGEVPETTYTITYSDITTSAQHSETVEFEKLMKQVSAKAHQLAAIQTPNSRAAAKIESAGEEQILEFLTKTIARVQMFHRVLNGLDQYFKTHMPPEQKNSVRGIKIELSSIRGTVVNANQLRQEYVSRKEEKEQLRKLGVREDEA